MGASGYSADVFKDNYVSRTAGGQSYFGHTSAIQQGAVEAKVHEKLDPARLNKAGRVVRESRDSDVHPNALAISVLFDVTGSLCTVPQVFVEKLGSLMSMLTAKGYVENPHVMFGAIGDAYSDRVPLQIGQFEGGNEMDDVLSKVYLEGNGGGQGTESYELALYFMARHAEMDCFEKRGKKGYLFIFGDEMPKDHVSADQVKRLIGDDIPADIPLKDIIEEVRTKFNLYYIMPGHTTYSDNAGMNSRLKDLFGESFVKMDNPEDVCETLVTMIASSEGVDVKSIEADLVAAGSSKASAARAKKVVVANA